MTPRKSSQGGPPEDLPIRARRGELLRDERASLEAALRAEPTLRAAYHVGRDFDVARRVQPGDDELILRASSRILEPSRPRASTRRVMTIFAAALLLVASGAAGASVLMAARRAPPSPQAPSDAPSDPSRAARAPARVPRAPAAPAPASSESALEPPLAAPSAAPPSEPRVAALASDSAVAKLERTAATLFRDARAARRQGELATARSLYAELQASFPESAEARVSRVALGKLLLMAGDGAAAERQFRLYLAGSGGDLIEEALLGRAEALGRLGRSGEERRVWQELGARYPSSVYAERARKRLDELAREAEPSERTR